MPLHSALRAVLDWFGGCTLIWLGGKSGGAVTAWFVDARLVSKKEPGEVEGRTPYEVSISGALTLGVSRGSRLDVPSLFPAS